LAGHSRAQKGAGGKTGKGQKGEGGAERNKTKGRTKKGTNISTGQSAAGEPYEKSEEKEEKDLHISGSKEGNQAGMIIRITRTRASRGGGIQVQE